LQAWRPGCYQSKIGGCPKSAIFGQELTVSSPIWPHNQVLIEGDKDRVCQLPWRILFLFGSYCGAGGVWRRRHAYPNR
jgi:hypothetical protein